jgi:hypothetical protein
MVYRNPDDRLVTYEDDRLATREDETFYARDSGGKVGTALLAGVLIVVAMVLIVWLLGGSDVDPTGTTFSPLETTLPVETGANPSAPG